MNSKFEREQKAAIESYCALHGAHRQLILCLDVSNTFTS